MTGLFIVAFFDEIAFTGSKIVINEPNRSWTI